MTNTVFQSMRPPFLILTPACVFLGCAASFKYLGAIPWGDLLVVLFAAVLAHISVNTFNEYLDFKSGLDALTKRTPFSGGSGALIENPRALSRVWVVAWLSLAGTIILGLYCVLFVSIKILPLGILGVFIILSYTQWLNKNAFLCLIAPGTAFGPLMVVGTALVLTGEFIVEAVLVSLLPFFLVNNLLLLNQLPDIAADKQVGRKHFAVVYGKNLSVHMYAIFAAAAIGLLISFVVQGSLRASSLFTLAPLALTVVVYLGLLKCKGQVEKMLPFLAINVFVAIITPIVLGLSILF